MPVPPFFGMLNTSLSQVPTAKGKGALKALRANGILAAHNGFNAPAFQQPGYPTKVPKSSGKK